MKVRHALPQQPWRPTADGIDSDNVLDEVPKRAGQAAKEGAACERHDGAPRSITESVSLRPYATPRRPQLLVRGAPSASVAALARAARGGAAVVLLDLERHALRITRGLSISHTLLRLQLWVFCQCRRRRRVRSGHPAEMVRLLQAGNVRPVQQPSRIWKEKVAGTKRGGETPHTCGRTGSVAAHSSRDRRAGSGQRSEGQLSSEKRGARTAHTRERREILEGADCALWRNYDGTTKQRHPQRNKETQGRHTPWMLTGSE